MSDPVNLEVAPLSDLAISIYLPRDTGPPTNHPLGLHTAYISNGDVTASAAMPDPKTMTAYAWLSSVDVVAPADAFTVVAFGDSITDGYSTTLDANQAWPTLLAKRLNADKTQQVAVVNQGISGNQVLRDGAGLSALARFDRDVLSRPGVKWVILLEGINDINIRGRMEGPNALTSDELIWGYRQIIARAHAHGIKVMGATIMPEEGVPTASERGEQIRQTVNRWIRANGNFDAVVDFDMTVRDPQRPVRLKQQFDPGDHIHPNDAGNQAMADAFDLSVFQEVKGNVMMSFRQSHHRRVDRSHYAFLAEAQTPAVRSPEVNADHTVTFRFRAPQATAVDLVGEVLQGKGPQRMTKGSDGVWTITIGPLAARNLDLQLSHRGSRPPGSCQHQHHAARCGNRRNLEFR